MDERLSQCAREKTEISINLTTLALLFVLLAPFIYLGIKGRFDASTKKVVAQVAPPKMALAELVHQANVNPTFESFFELGFAYQQKRRYQEAVNAYLKAIELNPQSVRAYNNLGAAYGDLGRYSDQVAASKKALELDPLFELARNNLRWAEQQIIQDAEKLRDK